MGYILARSVNDHFINHFGLKYLKLKNERIAKKYFFRQRASERVSFCYRALLHIFFGGYPLSKTWQNKWIIIKKCKKCRVYLFDHFLKQCNLQYWNTVGQRPSTPEIQSSTHSSCGMQKVVFINISNHVNAAVAVGCSLISILLHLTSKAKLQWTIDYFN